MEGTEKITTEISFNEYLRVLNTLTYSQGVKAMGLIEELEMLVGNPSCRVRLTVECIKPEGYDGD